MKSIFKRKNLKNRPFLPLSIVLVFLIVFLLFTSCQDEVVEIVGPDQQETIIPNSSLASLIQETTTMDGSIDNIIDNANCLMVNLPVTISVNGIEIIIDSEEDYNAIEAIFDEYDNDEDTIEITFPITIILNDYTEIEINNNDELEDFIDDCLGENEEDDDIECIDFQYPLTLLLYNTSLEIIETVTIEDDEALYNFIENLDGSVLASLNFPVNLILNDGSIVVVNNNQELEAAIEAAEDTCDEDDDYDWNDDDEDNNDDCTPEDVSAFLMECQQLLTLNDYTPGITSFTFSENNNASTLFEGDQPSSGTWDVSTNEEGVIVVLNFLPTPFSFLTDISELWNVVECNDEILQLEQGDNILIIEKLCNNDCYPEGVEVVECGENGFATFNLTEAFEDCTSVFPTQGYYETLADAQNETNALANNYTNLSNPQTIYVSVFVPPGGASIHEITLVVEDCASTCTELTVDDYLQTCIWNVVNYNNSDDLITFDLDFNDNGTVIITGDGQTITAMWSTTETVDGVSVEFSGVNGANIQAITGNWLIVECNEDRLEMTKATDTMVLEQTCT